VAKQLIQNQLLVRGIGAADAALHGFGCRQESHDIEVGKSSEDSLDRTEHCRGPRPAHEPQEPTYGIEYEYEGPRLCPAGCV